MRHHSPEPPETAPTNQPAITQTASRLPPDIERHVRRFDTPVRRSLRRLIRSSQRHADLAEVFPGAAIALFDKTLPQADRQLARERVEEGASLKSVAQVLQIPYWLRRLPPEAFRGPIPRLPLGEAFARRISGRLPQSRRHSAFWLKSIAFAVSAAHEDFAVWLADQPVFRETDEPEDLFAVLAAYAWFSRSTDTPANDLIVIPWRPEISFDTALCAAKSWFNRLRLVMQLSPGTIRDTWLEPSDINGYRFVPLLDKTSIIDEAHGMQNCVDQYAEALARDKCRLFSIRKGKTRVATLEIGPHPREIGVLTVTQLKARHNMPAPIEVWQTVYDWLGGQSGLKHMPPLLTPERPLNAQVWHSLMEPYRLEKDGAPWLAMRPTPTRFERHERSMTNLARKGGVSSWLFT